MSDNIFGHIFRARSLAYKTDEYGELQEFKKRVKQEIDGLNDCINPKFIMFKVTNKCNSGCVYCGYSAKNRHSSDNCMSEEQDKIQFEDFKRIIDEASEMGVYSIAYNGGEPLLHNDIEKIIAYSNEKKVLPILMTNGLLLPQKWDSLGAAGLKYIMISFDSLDPDVFKLQRGVSLQKTMEGINAALKMREKYGDMVIHITAIITKHNIEEMCVLADYCKQNNIWLEVCTYHHMTADDDVLSVDNEVICREAVGQLVAYKEQGYPISTSIEYLKHISDFCINKKKKPDNYNCVVGFTTLQVDGYLNARPCWDTSFSILGNLKTNSIKEIWSSAQMDDYRKKMIEGRCDGCWNMCNEVTALINEG